MGPEYKSYRDWIVQHNPDDKTPVNARLFVGYSNQWSAIREFKEGAKLRTLPDTTQAKGQTIHVIIMRAGAKHVEDSYKFSSTVGPSDSPDFPLHALDVIALSDPKAPR